jgi:hypothetical protein
LEVWIFDMTQDVSRFGFCGHSFGSIKAPRRRSAAAQYRPRHFLHSGNTLPLFLTQRPPLPFVGVFTNKPPKPILIFNIFMGFRLKK